MKRGSNIFRPIFLMAELSAREFFHEKVLWMTLIFSFAFMALSFAVARLSFYEPSRIALDFGLSAIFLSGSLSATILGAGLIARDMRDRTAHLVLTKPISRWQYMIGRFLGGALVISANSLGMYLAAFISFCALGGVPTTQLLLAPILQITEFLMLLAISIFFSTFTTAALASCASLSFWFLGHAMDDISAMVGRIFSTQGAAFSLVRILLRILPDFTVLTRMSEFSHHIPISWAQALQAVLYGLSFVAFMLCFSSLVFWKKDI